MDRAHNYKIRFSYEGRLAGDKVLISTTFIDRLNALDYTKLRG